MSLLAAQPPEVRNATHEFMRDTVQECYDPRLGPETYREAIRGLLLTNARNARHGDAWAYQRAALLALEDHTAAGTAAAQVLATLYAAVSS